MPISTTSEQTEGPQIIEPVEVTRQEITRCRFSAWYPQFRDVTFKSRIIPLPQEFIDYLNADSIFLPSEG